MTKSLFSLFLLASLLIVITGCRSSQDPPALPTSAGPPALPPLPTLAADEIALGQQVYTQHCASCHGPNLEGEADWKIPNEDGSFRAPPHDASGHTWHHSDAILIEAVKLGGERLPPALGSSKMPAFANVLTDEEITAVLTYFKSTWPDDLRTFQWEQTVMSEQ